MIHITALNHDSDGFQQVLDMLGEDTVENFANLSKEERRVVYCKYLVEHDPIEFDNFQWKDCQSIHGLMLFKEHMGGGEVEQSLLREARDIFYEENIFIIRSDLLREFMSDQLGPWEHSSSEKFVAVESLVRDLAITVDRRYGKPEDMDKDLRTALDFAKLERIEIEILDRGVPDGSDLATQATIMQIARAVRDLMRQFGHRLEVSKVLFWDADFNRGSSYCPAVYYDMTSYWDAPLETTKLQMWKGQISFEELMQIQIAEWTDPSLHPCPWIPLRS